MGAMTSCLRKPREGRGTSPYGTTPKVRGHRRNLSATFNIQDAGPDLTIMEQLNVNTATEEELMTLPGIDRQTAHNIVDYRSQLGGFRKIEDLALVSGVGATKLNVIRFEICVGKKKSSQNSSPSGSKFDLSADRSSNKSTPTRVNVNTSNVFQLMKVKGIGQYLAENIVAYRDKKGPFKSLDDLVKVKGIGNGILSAIRPYLVLGNEMDAPGNHINHNGAIPGRQSSQDSIKYSNGDTGGSYPNTPTHVPNGGPGLYPKLPLPELSMEDLLSIYGPLAQPSERAVVMPFDFSRNDRPVVRIATWNLQRFCSDKAGNLGVKEVICMTLLEQGISILCAQELADTEALQTMCNELNAPTLPKVKKWPARTSTWKCITAGPAGRMYQAQEYLGILYDSNKVTLVEYALLDKSSEDGTQFTRRPLLATFKAGRYDLIVVSLHLKARGYRNQDLDRLKEEVLLLPDLVTALKNHLPGEKDVMVLGDFNINPEVKDFDVFRNNGLCPVVPADIPTNISRKNMEGSENYDNIWLSSHAQKHHTGHYQVVRSGLGSPWIPDGWKWGGLASDHCPVWVEMYTDTDSDSAVIDTDLTGIQIR